MTFKIYGPSSNGPESSRTPKKRGKKAGPGVVENPEVENEACDALVVSPTTVSGSPSRIRFEEPYTINNILSSSLDSVDGRYFTHFVDRVSSLLLIYDNSDNINPFRELFPDLARSSPSMISAMQALGALHLSNTSAGQQRISHFQQAMGNYGEVVKSFRAKHHLGKQLQLTDFATCLLLCLFEVSIYYLPLAWRLLIIQMMDSQHHNWAVHLKGAREIYRILFSQHTDPSQEASRQAEINHPLRNFLVSLLSYLDVAGACATSDGTVVDGSYWRTEAGGWEYNLGTPSLSSDSKADNPHLVELRQAWSIMMEIQASISAFGRSKQNMPSEQQDMAYNELLNRLTMWRSNAPECVRLLDKLDDESLRSYKYQGIVEYAGCIEAYEKATMIFLHKVAAAGRPDWQTEGPRLQIMASRILTLIGKLAKDVGQLAVLWPLFIAGRETRNENEQNWVRQTMTEIRRFGFKVCDCAFFVLDAVLTHARTWKKG